jgi:hypothetical protein
MGCTSLLIGWLILLMKSSLTSLNKLNSIEEDSGYAERFLAGIRQRELSN